jgi:hypothetical protein
MGRPLVSCEEVRADQIKDGDLVWTGRYGEPWLTVKRVESLKASPRPMLRQAAPTPAPGLQAKLDEMRLHENTGDPSDEGYMDAIRELDEWLAALASQESSYVQAKEEGC